MNDIDIWQNKFENCDYGEKLIEKIKELNTVVKEPIDVGEIKKGLYYARKYHGSQTRQSGEPYYTHPIEVAIRVKLSCKLPLLQ